jgi:hypothetical protein
MTGTNTNSKGMCTQDLALLHDQGGALISDKKHQTQQQLTYKGAVESLQPNTYCPIKNSDYGLQSKF